MSKLYIIPTPIGNLGDFTLRAVDLLKKVDIVLAEDTRVSKKLLHHYDINTVMKAHHQFNEHRELDGLIAKLKSGTIFALISDAGCPGIADPGPEIVRLAHQSKIKVVPLVGPSSILLALMASGMSGQNFKFNGYLPIEKNERKSKIKNLEKTSIITTQIFMETPYRNNKFVSVLLEVLKPETKLCIACDITLTTEYIKTKKVKEWKSTKIDINKRPAIFLIQSD